MKAKLAKSALVYRTNKVLCFLFLLFGTGVILRHWWIDRARFGEDFGASLSVVLGLACVLFCYLALSLLSAWILGLMQQNEIQRSLSMPKEPEDRELCPDIILPPLSRSCRGQMSCLAHGEGCLYPLRPH